MTQTELVGTISHGTLLIEDLLPTFLEVIDEHDCRKFQEIVGESPIPESAKQHPDDPWWLSEAAEDMLDAAFDALDEMAPSGLFFGAHPGNSSDFGFWPIEDMDLS